MHKWQIFRAVTAAKDLLGITERSLTVLNALLTFHPEVALSKGSDCGLVVFPSNEQLSLRAHGMAPATLRRHLAALVGAGLVIRRDSPNGKRFSRKGQGGAIEVAYGFDITPLVARAPEIEGMADQVRTDRHAWLTMRERLTILRREAVKMIELGLEQDIDADWHGLNARYRVIVQTLPRSRALAELKAAVDALLALVNDIRQLLENHADSQNMTGNGSQDERHKQNSKPKNLNEFEAEPEYALKPALVPLVETAREPIRHFPLSMVMVACPDIAGYSKVGIHGWRDLSGAADLVRSVLGVSASAWNEAQTVLGRENAAVLIAVILQKAEAVKSAGGYLRALVDKAKAGQLSLGPVLMALLNQRNPQRRQAG